MATASDQTQQPKNDNSVAPSGGVIVGSRDGKESEKGFGSIEFPADLGGIEAELPKEVVAAGVKMQPTTVSIPQSVQQLGVKSSGANIPVPLPVTVTALPISDDQIAQGLRASITSSFRWLAEWCVRRLKHMHITLKSVAGKGVRTQK